MFELKLKWKFHVFMCLQVCQPKFSDGTDCSNPINFGKYIEEFTCIGVGSSDRMLKEMRLSFPSGHSSFSVYTMLYCAVSILEWRFNSIFDWKTHHYTINDNLKYINWNLFFCGTDIFAISDDLARIKTIQTFHSIFVINDGMVHLHEPNFKL